MFRIAAFLLLLGAPVFASDASLVDLKISNPVIYKAFDKARSAAGYMMIGNASDVSDVLFDVQTNKFRPMIHESQESDGIARMVHLDAVEIPAGGTVHFAPGGLHIMIMGLQPGELQAGETLDAVLVFDRAGEVPVTFTVEAMPMGENDHSDHEMTN